MCYEIEWIRDTLRGHMRRDLNFDYYARIIKDIDDYVNEEKIKLIYPKNMFFKDRQLEVFTFTDRHIFTAKVDSENPKHTSIEAVKIKDIKKLTKAEGNAYESCSLEIHFNNEDEKIVFDSDIDTIQSYFAEHRETIKAIFKHLVKNF